MKYNHIIIYFTTLICSFLLVGCDNNSFPFLDVSDIPSYKSRILSKNDEFRMSASICRTIDEAISLREDKIKILKNCEKDIERMYKNGFDDEEIIKVINSSIDSIYEIKSTDEFKFILSKINSNKTIQNDDPYKI